MPNARGSIAQVSLRLPASTRKQLARSAWVTGRTKSAIVAEAIEHYLSSHDPQQDALKLAIEEADRGEFAAPSRVRALFDRYASLVGAVAPARVRTSRHTRTRGLSR
jgi:predicted transcriptional regulator